MEDLLADKQILIIGFADVYPDISNANHQVDKILEFIKSGKSVLFSHDTTSYVNYDKNMMHGKIATKEYGTGEDTSIYEDTYLTDTVKNVTWGLSLNTILRSVVGMDRYGITSNAEVVNNGNKVKISELLKKGTALNSSSVDFKTLMKLAGDVAYQSGDKDKTYVQTQGYSNGVIEGKEGTKTNSAQKVNDGAITQYPFRMPSTIQVADTHAQYYQLGLETDLDINNRSDGKGDVVVWYTLADGTGLGSDGKEYGKYYGNSPKDVRNNYYFYSKGNVIYTGVGHSKVDNNNTGVTESDLRDPGKFLEMKLFVNAIVAAANVTSVKPQVDFVKSLSPSAEKESVRYYMTDQQQWVENNVVNKTMDLYLNIKDYNMVSADLSQEDLDKQEMTVQFFVEDEKGTIQEGSGTSAKLSDITGSIGDLTEAGNEKKVVAIGEDNKFHMKKNNAYGFTLENVEGYVENKNNGYKSSCKIYAKVTSTVYLYGEAKTETAWTFIDLAQRQLFDLD